MVGSGGGGGVNSFIGKGGEGRGDRVSRELIDWLEIFYVMVEEERGGGVEGKNQSCSGT